MSRLQLLTSNSLAGRMAGTAKEKEITVLTVTMTTTKLVEPKLMHAFSSSLDTLRVAGVATLRRKQLMGCVCNTSQVNAALSA